MKRDELIKKCLYYKGEEKCPYEEGTSEAMFWNYERGWVEDCEQSNAFKMGANLANYERQGLTDFESDDGVPITLKALLFNRYEYWCESGPEEFKAWYKEHYKKGNG